jgi:hypothetical protein
VKQKRSLTPGEVALARRMFGDAIDYSRVELVRGKWWPLQPRGVVMAPTGNIHFHPDDPSWSEDFGQAPLSLQGLFVHEMTHVWQTQKHGRYFLPLMRHPFCRYAYHFAPERRFGGYGLEQQAELVRHAFLAKAGQPVFGAPTLAQLSATLPFQG